MFVTSLSCYNQMLYEEARVNAMDEALELWEEVLSSRYFANKRISMIIFFVFLVVSCRDVVGECISIISDDLELDSMMGCLTLSET